MEHAAAQRERVGETLGKLEVEQDDLRRETETVDASQAAAAEALARAQAALEQVRLETAARESELVVGAHRARGSPARRARARAGAGAQRGAAGVARGARGQPRGIRRRGADGARPGQRDRSASRAPSRTTSTSTAATSARSKPALATCCSTSSSNATTRRPRGLALVREHDAGRCGFVVIDPGSNGYHPARGDPDAGHRAGLRRAARRRTARRDDPESGAGGVRRRDVRPGGGDVAADVGAGGHARRRRLPGPAPRLRRRQGRIARHSRHQARNQGAARTDSGRPRRACAAD